MQPTNKLRFVRKEVDPGTGFGKATRLILQQQWMDMSKHYWTDGNMIRDVEWRDVPVEDE
jgi:hypothetical protein